MACLFDISIAIILLLNIVRTGFAIDCFRCNSSHTLDCLEKFIKPNSLVPEPCSDVFEARYCIKVTGIYQGVEGTHRFCSAKDMGNYCEYITREGDEKEFRSCVYTCASDGCNTATRTKVISNLLTASIFLILFIFLFFA